MRESHSLSDLLFETAVRAAIRGEYKKALEYLDQVLIMNPRHPKAREEKERWTQYFELCKEGFRIYHPIG